MTEIEELATKAIDCGFRVHKSLGPGLLESVYEAVLAVSLSKAGLRVERQKPIAILFEGIAIPDAFRADLVVEDRLIIEIKSIERLAPVHAKQLLTYVRLTEQPLGLLMNFGCETLPGRGQAGCKRPVWVHRFPPPLIPRHFVPSCLRVEIQFPIRRSSQKRNENGLLACG